MESKEILNNLIDKIEKQSGSKLVFGQIVEKGKKTIIPVAKITSGMGTIKGWCSKIPFVYKNSNCENEEISAGKIKIEPLGVLEITETETKFVPITNLKKTLTIFALGVIFGLVFLRKNKKNAQNKINTEKNKPK